MDEELTRNVVQVEAAAARAKHDRGGWRFGGRRGGGPLGALLHRLGRAAFELLQETVDLRLHAGGRGRCHFVWTLSLMHQMLPAIKSGLVMAHTTRYVLNGCHRATDNNRERLL